MSSATQEEQDKINEKLAIEKEKAEQDGIYFFINRLN